MDKVLKTVNAEIEKLKASIESDKSLLINGLNDIKEYNNALKLIGPKMGSLEKLYEVQTFINNLNSPKAEPKPASRRGRPRKVKCN